MIQIMNQYVPIVCVATAWQSPDTGQVYILILNESLWMPQLPNSLINPNQLRYYGTIVQDNPVHDTPMHIRTHDARFSMGLQMHGTIVCTETRTPTESELNSCPRIVMSSPHAWDPHNVSFPTTNRTLEEEMVQIRGDMGVSSTCRNVEYMEQHHNETALIEEDSGTIISSISNICTRIINSVRVDFPRKIADVKKLAANYGNNTHNSSQAIDTGADVPIPTTFVSSERHTDVSPSDLSDRWFISIPQAKLTIKKSTQKFLRSAILPLTRRYRADQMFYRKQLSGQWSTNTMDGRVKSLDGNRYAQVFSNKQYFSKLYPIERKNEAGSALKLFCQEFGVPEHLTFDGSKEQNGKNTDFMHQIKRHDIKYHTTEANLHNQNPCKGVIRVLRKMWYRVMVRKRVPRVLWDYGMK